MGSPKKSGLAATLEAEKGVGRSFRINLKLKDRLFLYSYDLIDLNSF
jgi:hypothetical protein